MFFENELIGSVSFLRFLLALLVGLAPVAVMVALKLVLYRRRLPDDETSAARERPSSLSSTGALHDFALVLANEIENFRNPERRFAARMS